MDVFCRETAADDKIRRSRVALRDFHVWSYATARSSLTVLSLPLHSSSCFRIRGCLFRVGNYRAVQNGTWEILQVFISSLKFIN